MRIILGLHMVRYPLGGALSSSLQWLLGLHRLGHEVYVFERANYANSCFDPMKKVMRDDCAYGVGVVADLMKRHGLGDRWCYVDARGEYHGLSEARAAAVFASADVFIDRGTHGAWLDSPPGTLCRGPRVLVDGEPAYNQIHMSQQQEGGGLLQDYDHYFTVGYNIGAPGNPTPTAGKSWGHHFPPVDTTVVQPQPPPDAGPFTTVMKWQSHKQVEFGGRTYGQKDVEFSKFRTLPRISNETFELAITGKKAPDANTFAAQGWLLRDALEVTRTFDAYLDYVACSKGEFSFAKEVFVAFETGWFSDRSAVYLASGRPVVTQDTGFSQHLPTGCGLFAVNTAEEAADAVNRVSRDYRRHSQAAREVACEYMDASKVLGKMLAEIGM
jgi:hypothetical protein